MPMEHTMKDNGQMINNMGTESNHGLMEHDMRDCMLKAKKKERDVLLSRMEAIMKASLKNLKSTEKVSCTINLEEKRMKDSSKMIKYMDMEYFIGFQA